MRVFVAGATGAVGQRLVPGLVAAGHVVTATTRSAAKAARLRDQGAMPVVVDGLDRPGMLAAVKTAQPDAIVHQMTALASMKSYRNFDAEFATTNELRTKGTDYLLEAAADNHVDRFITQSYTGWNNPRTGGMVKTEADGLDPHPLPKTVRTMAAIRHVEESVPSAGGIVLRYGSFYAPGASAMTLDSVRKRRLPIVGSGAGVWSFTEITDAAAAAIAALDVGNPGVYNVVDDDPALVTDWLPYLAGCLRAKPPLHLPVWAGRLVAGDMVVALMTQVRGAANEKARRELGWEPKYPSWRDGFPMWVRG